MGKRCASDIGANERNKMKLVKQGNQSNQMVFLNGILLTSGDYEFEDGVPWLRCEHKAGDVVQVVSFDINDLLTREEFVVNEETAEDYCGNIYITSGGKFTLNKDAASFEISQGPGVVTITAREKVIIDAPQVLINSSQHKDL